MIKDSRIAIFKDYLPSKRAMKKHGFGKYVLNCLRHLLSPGSILLDLWSEFYFDAKYKVSTSMIVQSDSLGYRDKEVQKHAVRHHPSAPYRARRALGVLKRHLPDFENRTFVDYGCGAGRVMIIAAEAGFKRVIGVELSPDLLAVCRKNVERYSLVNKAVRIEPEFLDAAKFVPPREASVFYFFVPFSLEIYQKVILNIDRSIRESPRDVYVLDRGSDFDFGKYGYQVLYTVATIKIYKRAA